MIVCCANQCAYCRSSIVPGQRWVREKICAPALNGRDPSYHRYHAEPFAGQEGSCWEKHQMEQEIARTTPPTLLILAIDLETERISLSQLASPMPGE